MKKFADPLIPILTLECCKSIFSKNWQLREEGLKWLDQEVRNPKNIKNDDPQLMFTAVMGAIASTLGDKIVQVHHSCATPYFLATRACWHLRNLIEPLIPAARAQPAQFCGFSDQSQERPPGYLKFAAATRRSQPPSQKNKQTVSC